MYSKRKSTRCYCQFSVVIINNYFDYNYQSITQEYYYYQTTIVILMLIFQNLVSDQHVKIKVLSNKILVFF